MMNIYVASDHAAVKEKDNLISSLSGYKVIDCGPTSDVSCDYPDYAKIVADKIKADNGSLGILLCGTGIGMSIACNFEGVFSARCCSVEDAKMARQHNHARVICLGARQLNASVIIEIVEQFLETEPSFDNRHIRRLLKIGGIA